MKKVFIVMALAIGVSSCMKQKDLDSDLGTPVTPLEVQKAVAEAWGGADPASLLKVDDFVYLESEQRIQSGNPFGYFDEATTVTSKSVSQDKKYVLHDLVRQYRENSTDGTSKQSSVTEHFDVPNTLASSNEKIQSLARKDISGADLMQNSEGDQVKQRQLSIDVASYMFQICALEPKDGMKIQCYNLKTTKEERPAPQLVKDQPNCGGQPNCKMNVQILAFDVVLSKEENGAKTSEKIKFQMAITQDAPYFARVLDYCQTGLVYVPAAGQKVLVNVCSYVKNFKYGHD